MSMTDPRVFFDYVRTTLEFDEAGKRLASFVQRARQDPEARGGLRDTIAWEAPEAVKAEETGYLLTCALGHLEEAGGDETTAFESFREFLLNRVVTYSGGVTSANLYTAAVEASRHEAALGLARGWFVP